jgi:hypothetical protein
MADRSGVFQLQRLAKYAEDSMDMLQGSILISTPLLIFGNWRGKGC